MIKKGCIFKYELNKSWPADYCFYSINIFNKRKNNVIISCDAKQNKEYKTINKYDLKRIKKILSLVDNLSTNSFVDGPNIVDGVENKFNFDSRKSTREITCYNLGAYVIYYDMPKDAQILLEIHNQINDILRNYDISFPLKVPKNIKRCL